MNKSEENINTDIDNSEKLELEENISIHIFSVSAAMVGVCMTVIGIFQIGDLKILASITDNVLANDAIIFLGSCAVSYIALRSPSRRHLIEKVADTIFLCGLLLMAIVCILVAYELL